MRRIPRPPGRRRAQCGVSASAGPRDRAGCESRHRSRAGRWRSRSAPRPADGLAELDGQHAQHRFGFEVSRESGRSRSASTSGIVKCCMSATMSANASWNASTSGLVASLKRAMQAVEDRVRRFVRDDVVREAGVDAAAGHVLARSRSAGLEVAELERDFAAGCRTHSPAAARAAGSAAAGRRRCRRTAFPGLAPAARAPGDRAPARSARSSSSPPRRPSAGGTADCLPPAPSHPAPAARRVEGRPARTTLRSRRRRRTPGTRRCRLVLRGPTELAASPR